MVTQNNPKSNGRAAELPDLIDGATYVLQWRQPHAYHKPLFRLQKTAHYWQLLQHCDQYRRWEVAFALMGDALLQVCTRGSETFFRLTDYTIYELVLVVELDLSVWGEMLDYVDDNLPREEGE